MQADHSLADQLTGAARGTARSRPMGWLARLGLTARGLVWLLMGVLTLLVARGGRAEVDQKGALTAVVARPYGGAVVLLMAVGFAGYALWRLGEAAFGVVGEGRARSARLKSLARGVAYAVLSVTAFSVLEGSRSSQAGQQRTATTQLFASQGGRLLVGLAGVAVLAVGVMLVLEGLRRRFLRYLDRSELSRRTRRWLRRLGTVGSVARGAVVALVGWYLLDAALTGDASRSTGLDGAVKSLRSWPSGGLLLAAAGVGLVLFGVYGLMEARYRRV